MCNGAHCIYMFHIIHGREFYGTGTVESFCACEELKKKPQVENKKAALWKGGFGGRLASDFRRGATLSSLKNEIAGEEHWNHHFEK